MARRRNSARSDVDEVFLRARWILWERNRYALEVYVVGKWRGAGYVMATKPRKLTSVDVKKVSKSVNINTGGKVAVIGLTLQEYKGE